MADAICVVGRIPGDRRWLGLARGADGYELVVGGGDGQEERIAGDRRGLLCVAIAHFLAALDEVTNEREATQQDLAELVEWLLVTEDRPAPRALLRDALDAIEDGLAVDVVVARLETALRHTPAEGPSATASLVLRLLRLD